MSLGFPGLTYPSFFRKLRWKERWAYGLARSATRAGNDPPDPARGALLNPRSGSELDGGDLLPADRSIDQHGISKASRVWSSRRDKFYDPGLVFHCRARDVFRVGSCWQIKPAWIERAGRKKYDQTALRIAEAGWDEQSPAMIGIGSNGFVTVLDGNHRLSLILLRDLVPSVPTIPVRFHYFDVGDVINPLRPQQVWSGTNLPFICYPLGTCGKCAPCRRMLAEVERKLRQHDLLPVP